MAMSGSSFATRQLEKFGWKAGEGLGKRKHGICAPIRASMKFSRRGIGCTYTEAPEEAFWSSVYETAVSQIGNVESSDLVKAQGKPSVSPGLRRTASADDARQISPNATSSPAKATLKLPKINFQRQSVLNGGIETPLFDNTVSLTPSSPPPLANPARDCSDSSEEEEEAGKKASEKPKPSKSLYKQPIFSLSESSLLKLGARRTGHPAARFGLRCNGKLSRAAKFL